VDSQLKELINQLNIINIVLQILEMEQITTLRKINLKHSLDQMEKCT